MLNRWVLSRDRQTATEGAEVTRSVRLFQTRAAATGKARSPTVRSGVRLTINDEEELERSRWRASTSATWQSSSVRYAGADPCRHLYTRTDSLNAIRSGVFSQCSWRRSGVMCWKFDEENMRLTLWWKNDVEKMTLWFYVPWLMRMFWFIGCRSNSSFGMWQNLSIINITTQTFDKH